jgi:hypothetical protein
VRKQLLMKHRARHRAGVLVVHLESRELQSV